MLLPDMQKALLGGRAKGLCHPVVVYVNAKQRYITFYQKI